MITSQSIQTVIDNLAKVLPMAKRDEQLDMLECGVNDYHQCRTVHCHGGWYAVATINPQLKVDYADGAQRLAEDLGFGDRQELDRWAKHNAEIWGNRWGDNMFVDERAFTPGSKTHASNLRDIYDHWCEVQIRQKLWELENNIEI